MSGKNKGGREVRKPKTAKAVKTDESASMIAKVDTAKKSK